MGFETNATMKKTKSQKNSLIDISEKCFLHIPSKQIPSNSFLNPDFIRERRPSR